MSSIISRKTYPCTIQASRVCCGNISHTPPALHFTRRMPPPSLSAVPSSGRCKRRQKLKACTACLRWRFVGRNRRETMVPNFFAHRHAPFDVLRGTLSPMMCNCFWRPTAAGSLLISMLRHILHLETDRLTSLFCGSTRAVPARVKWQQVGCD